MITTIEDVMNATEIARDMASKGVLLAYHRKALQLAIESMWDTDECACHRREIEPILEEMLDFGDLQDALDAVTKLRFDLSFGGEDEEVWQELHTCSGWLIQVSNMRDVLHNAEVAELRGRGGKR